MGVSLYLDPIDPDNPVSILHMARGKVAEKIVAIPDSIAMLTDKELRDEIKPTRVDYLLRLSFWKEYEAAVKEKRPQMAVMTVLGRICSKPYFYQKFLEDPYRVAWLVRPVSEYMVEIDAVLFRMTERLWEIADTDFEVENKDGRKVKDPRLMAVVLDAIRMVEARSKGQALQRSESRSLVGHVGRKKVTQRGQQALQARMKDLSEKLHGTVIDGTVLEPTEQGVTGDEETGEA